MNLTEQ